MSLNIPPTKYDLANSTTLYTWHGTNVNWLMDWLADKCIY